MTGWIFVLTALFSLLLTGRLRRYALARRLLDIPNERSSHTVPTPRGGGVAIVLTFLMILPLLGWVGELPAASLWALFWGWVILLGAFVVDATVTLVRRVRRGERFYQAQNSHAYQYAARRYGAHPPVSLAFGAINLCWLLPVVGWMDELLGVVMAYAPLVWLAVRFKAGARELQEVLGSIILPGDSGNTLPLEVGS